MGLRATILLLCGLSMGACDHEGPACPTGALLVARVSGNGQRSRVGTTLTQPLVVLVTGTDGQPVANRRVDFAVVEGQGTLSVESTLSSTTGQASTRLTLGNRPGPVTVQATAFGSSAGVLFTATATTDSAGAPPGSVDGLVLYLPLDGDVDDHSGNGYHSAAVGAVRFVEGPVGLACYFDGYSYVESTPTRLPAGGEARTVALWARVDQSVAREAHFAGYGEFGWAGRAFVMGADATRPGGPSELSIYFAQWGTGIGCGICSEFNPMELGYWYHVAVTSAGSHVTLYVNGSPVARSDMEMDTRASTPFYIGSLPGDLAQYHRLNGALDEVRVYDRVLSGEEIQAHFLAGHVVPVPAARLAPSEVTR